MTHVQQVLFELETDYLGHPYYVSGHALFNAIARRVGSATRRSLCVSHGVFVPGEYGEYPNAHSQDGYGGVLGSSLPPVDTYADLFLYRDPAQRWLLESRPRDLHNSHDLHTHGGRLAFAPRCHVGRPAEMRNHKRSVQWYLHCYLHAGRDDGVVPIEETSLEGLRVGGARNYGLGEVSVADTNVVDLDALTYDRLEAADPTAGYVLELVTPYVLRSTYPGADEQSVPWWWAPTADTATPGDGTTASAVSGDSGPSARTTALRRRRERLVDDGTSYRLETLDHGQVVGYAGNEPVQTARNGVLRVGTHSRFGFGELRVRPAETDRVPDHRGDEGGAD